MIGRMSRRPRGRSARTPPKAKRFRPLRARHPANRPGHAQTSRPFWTPFWTRRHETRAPTMGAPVAEARSPHRRASCGRGGYGSRRYTVRTRCPATAASERRQMRVVVSGPGSRIATSPSPTMYVQVPVIRECRRVGRDQAADQRRHPRNHAAARLLARRRRRAPSGVRAGHLKLAQIRAPPVVETPPRRLYPLYRRGANALPLGASNRSCPAVTRRPTRR